ncbi:MAG: hypothetical protein NZ990_18400 [Myxococcota bacterium]|nr:hypothetical protein [Myxococcota bacterium]
MSTPSAHTLPESARLPGPPAAWRTLRPGPPADASPSPVEPDSAELQAYLSQGHLGQAVTLLEVVKAVAEVADNDEEVLATMSHMLRSGRVRLSQGIEAERADPAA